VSRLLFISFINSTFKKKGLPCLKIGILMLDCISYECVFPAFAHPCSKTCNDLSQKRARFCMVLAVLCLNLIKLTFPVIHVTASPYQPFPFPLTKVVITIPGGYSDVCFTCFMSLNCWTLLLNSLHVSRRFLPYLQ
jgi:hypothetical protein